MDALVEGVISASRQRGAEGFAAEVLTHKDASMSTNAAMSFRVFKGVTITDSKGKEYRGGAGFEACSDNGREVQLVANVPALKGMKVEGNVRFTLEALIRLAIRVTGSSLTRVLAPHQYVPIRAIKSHKEKRGPDTESMMTQVQGYRGRYGPPRPESVRNLLSSPHGIQRGSVSLKMERVPSPEGGPQDVYYFTHNRFSIEMLIEFSAFILSDVAVAREDDRYSVPFLVVRAPEAWKGTGLAPGQPAILPEVRSSSLQPKVVQVGAAALGQSEEDILSELTRFDPPVLLHLASLMRQQFDGAGDSLATMRFGGIGQGFKALLPILEKEMTNAGVNADLSTLYRKLSAGARASIEQERAELAQLRQDISDDAARLLEQKIEELELQEQIFTESSEARARELKELEAKIAADRAEIDLLFEEAARKDDAAETKLRELGARTLELSATEARINKQLSDLGRATIAETVVQPLPVSSPNGSRNGAAHSTPTTRSEPVAAVDTEAQRELRELEGDGGKEPGFGIAQKILKAWDHVHGKGYGSQVKEDGRVYLQRGRQKYNCRTDDELRAKAKAVVDRQNAKSWRPSLGGAAAGAKG